MTSIVMEEYELLGDSKYRSYMSLVDKALRAFEYTTEWPDLIAALGKLNKVSLHTEKKTSSMLNKKKNATICRSCWPT